MECGCSACFSLVGISEFAEVCGVTKAAVMNWQMRGTPGFPLPIQRLRSGPVWFRWQAQQWQLSRGQGKTLSALPRHLRAEAERLLDLGWTQERVAKRIDCSQSMVSKIEVGRKKRLPSTDE